MAEPGHAPCDRAPTRGGEDNDRSIFDWHASTVDRRIYSVVALLLAIAAIYEALEVMLLLPRLLAR
jgi:hypothetical protein